MSSISDAVASARNLSLLDDQELAEQAQRLALSPLPASVASPLDAVDLLISCVDLTALESTDTQATIDALVARALRPDELDPTCPTTAAVCVHSDRVYEARSALPRASEVRLAAVSGGFPHGRVPLPARLLETQCALDDGAQEIDMVMDRAAFLSGDWETVADSILEMASLVHDRGARLKVILETGELPDASAMRDASFLAMASGADFIKTSTGKAAVSATLLSTSVLMIAARQWFDATGAIVGVKPAGGFRTHEQALALLPLAGSLLGEQWLSPQYLRIGASSLLTSLVAHRARLLGRDESVEQATSGY